MFGKIYLVHTVLFNQTENFLNSPHYHISSLANDQCDNTAQDRESHATVRTEGF